MQEIFNQHFTRTVMRPRQVLVKDIGKGIPVYPTLFIFIPMLAMALGESEKMVLNKSIYALPNRIRRDAFKNYWGLKYDDSLSRRLTNLKLTCHPSKLHLQGELKLGNTFEIMFGIKDKESLIEYLEGGWQICEADFAQWCHANGKIVPKGSVSLGSLL